MPVKLSDLTNELGRQLVHNILVRKGNTYLMNKAGTRLKPVAQVIMNRAMDRLASKESPDTIVRDLEAQLLLLKGTS